VVFPEVAALFGVLQSERWHPEIDSGVHTLMVIEQATKLSQDPVVRFAAPTHHIGRAPHCARSGRYHLLSHKPAELRRATVLDLLEHTDALRRPEHFAQFILACERTRGRKGLDQREYPQAQWLREARALVAGGVG
jgi:tRNA nucleotidyltransferase (CCA-adding enzyme)